jgi:hypothetical protein
MMVLTTLVPQAGVQLPESMCRAAVCASINHNKGEGAAFYPVLPTSDSP